MLFFAEKCPEMPEKGAIWGQKGCILRNNGGFVMKLGLINGQEMVAF